jgi:hypothetical protein
VHIATSKQDVGEPLAQAGITAIWHFWPLQLTSGSRPGGPLPYGPRHPEQTFRALSVFRGHCKAAGNSARARLLSHDLEGDWMFARVITAQAGAEGFDAVVGLAEQQLPAAS